MKKIVTISGKEYSMKSSAYTQFKYKNDTGRKLLNDIQEIANLKDVETNIGMMDDLTGTLLKMAYIMIEEADKSQVTTFEDFLKGIDGLYDNTDWINEVVELAASPISRGIQRIPQQ